LEWQKEFMTQYMDGSKLQGFVGSDVVRLGPFYTRTNFGCIERDKGHWEYNGIVGVGLPDEQAPTMPLLYALANPNKDRRQLLPADHTTEMIQSLNEEKERLMPGFVYALLLTHQGGELQVGGYVADSVRHHPVFTPVLPAYCIDQKCTFKHFAVHVQRLHMDGVELIRDARGTLDSGTSCLIIPKAAISLWQLRPLPLTLPLSPSPALLLLTTYWLLGIPRPPLAGGIRPVRASDEERGVG